MTQVKAFAASVSRWWAFISGVWLSAASVVLIVIALDMRSDAQRDALAAGVQCWRTMTLGPYTTADSRSRGVYPAALQAWAESAIPKTCPDIPDHLKPPTAFDRPPTVDAP